MDFRERGDINILLNGDSFTQDDAETLKRSLEPHFQPRLQVESAIVLFGALPGAPPPADVIIRIVEYVLAQLDDVGIGVLSNYIFRAIEALRQRQHGIDATFDIQVVEDEEHGRRTKWRVRGQARSADAIRELIKQAIDAGTREASDDD